MNLNDYPINRPLKTTAERVFRTYWGGRELDRRSGIENPQDGRLPEEWMFSVIRSAVSGGSGTDGLCYLADAEERISLKELIDARPAEMLGSAHAAEYKTSMGMLVKLIDSKYRLSVQVHPDKPTAERLFNSRFGKTEAWHIFSTRTDGEEPCLYIGFREGVTPEKWEESFRRQDYDEMISMLYKIKPTAGETYIIRGGVPHAVGPGCFLVEIQEPTDITIRLERVNPNGDRLTDQECHQGLGFERMFECFHYDSKTEEQNLAQCLVKSSVITDDGGAKVESLINYGVTECFKMEKITVSDAFSFERSNVFSGLYVFNGKGILNCGGVETAISPNDQFFIPASCEEFSVKAAEETALELFRFYGPDVQESSIKEGNGA